MLHPLEKRIGTVRRRVRQVVLLYALGRLVVALVAAVALLGLADFLIHFQDRGIRVICSLTVLAVAAWSGRRFLWPAVRAGFRDVNLALRVEQRFPHLKERLASTIDFLRQPEDDPQAGSAELRRAVIVQTTAEVEGLDLAQAIETRPARRAVVLAVLACLAAGALVAIDPASSRIALARLANPLGDAAWPQVNHLVCSKRVDRLALGQPFEVEVRDRRDGAKLPDKVYIHYRYEGDGQPGGETSEEMRFTNGVMVARKEQVTRPFAYRAVGGDDDSMPWIELEVVEPPAIEWLAVKLHYPAYTGWPPEAADKHIRALVGTRVEVTARTTKRLGAAALSFEDGSEIPAQTSDDGYAFSVPAPGGAEFVVERSGAYWFDLKDEEGFPGGQQVRYEIRAIPDHAPSVTFELPAANGFVTADAAVPLRIVAKDDLAIRQVALHYARSDKSEEGETVTPLYEGPAKIERPAGAAAGSMAELGESRLVEHRWELAALGLKPGAQITLYASATDYQPLPGQSHPRRLTIITPDELEDRLAERQDFIFNELSRILKLQRDSRSDVAGLEIQLGQLGRLSKQDIDHLQGAELTQRQVERGLASPTEGVTTQIVGLLADLENNKVDNPDIERRMQGLLDEIRRLGRDHLPAIARELTASLKGAQTQLQSDPARQGEPRSDTPQKPDTGQGAPAGAAGAGPPRATAESLAAAGKHQDAVIKSLEQTLGELAEWDNYRRFHRELGHVRRDQEELNRETAEVGRKTLTKEFKDLEPQQQVDLVKLSQRQLELGRRFDQIQQRMERAAAETEPGDPLAAATIADALNHARQQAVGGQMRQAGGQIQENQVGQAAQRQDQVADDLEELLDILSNRREHELGQLVKKLREAEERLSGFRQEQEGLRKQFDQASRNADEAARRQDLQRLSRQQKQLQEEAQRFARLLQRLQADQAGRSVQRGGAKMGQAGEKGAEGDAQTATDQAAGAGQDLDQAQEELAENRRRAEMDLAIEQLARLADGLTGMKVRQEKLLEETRYYDGLGQSQGELTRPQATSVRNLAHEQQGLQEETEALAQKLSAAPVFQLGLKGAGREMSLAAGLLDRGQTGTVTQEAQQNALARFKQILEALAAAGAGQDGQQARAGSGAGQQVGDGVRALAELKLLKLMQEEINRRTRELEDVYRRTKALSPEQQRQYVTLSGEQGELADLLLDMTNPVESNPQDDPETLPDVREPNPPDQGPAAFDAQSAAEPAAPEESRDPPAAAPPANGSLDDELLKGLGGDPLEGLDPPDPAGDDRAPEDKSAGKGTSIKGETKPQRKAAGDLDEELLEGLGDGEDVELDTLGTTEEQNPLVRISREMREVERMIAGAKSDDKTQKLQQKIVTDLEKLIKECEQCQKQLSGSQGSRNQGTAQREKVDQPENASGRGGQPRDSHARNSSDRRRNDQARQPDKGEIEGLLKDFWGTLPQRMRNQTIQPSAEDFLPKYALEIAEYFKTLVDRQQDER